MSEVRKTAHESISALTGADHISGSNKNESHDNYNKKIVQSLSDIKISRNRCDHHPLYFNAYKPPEEHTRPLQLKKIQDKISRAILNPKECLKSLQQRVSELGEVKQVRSERRHAAGAILQVMLQYMDYSNGRIWYPIKGEWHDLKLTVIAETLKMKIGRVKEAFGLLIKAGYVTSDRKFKKSKDKRFALPSRKHLTGKFFKELDAEEERAHLKKFKDNKVEEVKTPVEPRLDINIINQSPTIKTNFSQHLNTAISNVLKRTPKSNPRAQDRELCGRALELHHQDPSKSCIEWFNIISSPNP